MWEEKVTLEAPVPKSENTEAEGEGPTSDASHLLPPIAGGPNLRRTSIARPSPLSSRLGLRLNRDAASPIQVHKMALCELGIYPC